MKYKFGDIIYNITEKRKPTEEDRLNYIGLEHLDSGSLFVSRWGAERTPEGEKIVMKKGDVLFGKRRAYQKKVAISPIDGVFSAHGMVLRPKENVICKEFLPFFISSDYFLNEAIRISVGGLSPTINWKDIKELEFNLPSIDEQKVLAEKLWAAYEVKQSYLKMIDATDEMVKAQFIEMFGAVEKSNPLSDVIELTFPGEWGEDDNDGTGIKVIRTTNFTNIGKLNMKDVVTRKIDSAKIDKKRLHRGDIILERSGGTNENPVGRVVYFDEEGDYLFNNFTQLLRCKSDYNSIFVFYALFSYYQSNKAVLRQMAKKTTGIMNLKMDDYWKIPIPMVDIDEQEGFVKIYKQADKSKAELRKSIDAIDKVIKSLINENL